MAACIRAALEEPTNAQNREPDGHREQTPEGFFIHGQHADGEGEEHQRQPRGETAAGQAELRLRMARGELLAVHQVADHDHRPRENHEYRSHGGDQVERARNRVTRVEQHNGGQQHHGREEQRVTWHAGLGNLTQERGCAALAGQAEGHARGREDTGVRRGGCAGNHHEVDDVRGDAQARQGEHGDEGAPIGADEAPGGNHQDGDERTHVEDHDAHRHGVDCPGQGLFGVLGFCRGGTDEL